MYIDSTINLRVLAAAATNINNSLEIVSLKRINVTCFSFCSLGLTQLSTDDDVLSKKCRLTDSLSL